MYGCELPCMHTVTDESVIDIKYPSFDVNKFIDKKIFNEIPSSLKSHLSFQQKDDDACFEDSASSIEDIEDALKRAHSLFSSNDSNIITVQFEIIVKESTKDALKLGLKTIQIDDFIKFYLINY